MSTITGSIIKKTIKSVLKRTAYIVFAFISRIRRFPRLKSEYEVKAVQDKKNETFFGYYDKFPENSEGTVIYHAADKTYVHPSKISNIKIVISGPQISGCLKTRAFNWQQGSRLMWINDSEIIFNDYDAEADTYICRRYDVRKGKEQVYSYPVQDAYQDRYYISIDYHLLSLYAPDYGYFCRKGKDLNSENAINMIDFKSGKAEVLFTADAAAGLLELNKNNISHYYFNHVMISNDGLSFIFMFRYSDKRKYRNDSLFVYDINKKEARVLVKKGMVSHCCWLNNKKIMAYMEYEKRRSYFTIDTDKAGVTKMFGEQMFRDGHPSLCGEYYITDSYPDRNMIQKLYKICKSGKKEILAEVYHSSKFFGSKRCDLHPKVKSDIIYFDSVLNGRRSLYRMKHE